MKYVNKKMIVAINRLAIKLSGGISLSSTNIRDGQSLGFVDRIFQNSMFGEEIYPDIFYQAAAYLFYIIKNHLFIDGNKRTGLAVALTFLEWNRIIISPMDEDKVFDRIVEIAGGVNDPEKVIGEQQTGLEV